MRREISSIPNVPTPGHRVMGTPQSVDTMQRSPQSSSRVAVLTPKGGEVVTVGHSVLIRWHNSCFPGLVFHQIQLSTDGGATYTHNISPLLDAKDYHYLWHPTDDVVTRAARIRVIAINWGEAASDGLFMIVSKSHNKG